MAAITRCSFYLFVWVVLMLSASAQSQETITAESFGVHSHYPTAANPYVWPDEFINFGSYRVWDNYEGVLWPYIQRNAPQGIVRVTRRRNVVTVETSGPHQIYSGSATTVVITGVQDPSFDGTFAVSSVRDQAAFSYQQAGPDASSSGGTADDYDWTKLDAVVALAQSSGKQIVYTLGPTPIWATAVTPARVPVTEARRNRASYEVTVVTSVPHGVQLNPYTRQFVVAKDIEGKRNLNGVGHLVAVPDSFSLRFTTYGVSGTGYGDLGTGGTLQVYDWGPGANLNPALQPPAPATSMEPDLTRWENFIRHLVKRYCGCDRLSHPSLRIAIYENWNEPNLWGGATGTSGSVFFSPAAGRSVEASTEAQLRLSESAWRIIKAHDTSAVIVSPSATGATTGLDWLRTYLGEGGSAYFDVLGYHLYVAGPPEEVIGLLDAVRAIPGAADRPLWDTESGWGGSFNRPPFPESSKHAAWVARAHILRFWKGVGRVFWYDWSDQCWTYVRLTLSDERMVNYSEQYPQGCGSHVHLTGISSAGRAYSEVFSWLVDARVKVCSRSVDALWTCELERNGTIRGRLLWSEGGVTQATVMPEWGGTLLRTLSGGTFIIEQGQKLVIGEEPVLLE